MIIKLKNFSSNKEDKKTSSDKVLAISGTAGGGYILSKTKSGRLTGKVTRYHDAPIEVIDKIKEEGLKGKYASDPNNLTNTIVNDVDMSKKENLIYTAKDKATAKSVGASRAAVQGKIKSPKDLIREGLGISKHHKVLKLEFDYDDIKNMERIKNPELRGANNAKEFYENLKKIGKIPSNFPNWKKVDPVTKMIFKQQYKSLDDGTHIFKGNISSDHIVGGKGYKKRTAKQVINYIKNNPKRFGKELGKVTAGALLTGYGLKKGYDYMKNKKK